MLLDPRTVTMARVSLRVVIAAALLISASAAAQQPGVRPTAPPRSEAPRLVVILVIDQFRADYVEMYGHQWTSGLRRLYDRGAVFPLAMYPYSGTVTCPGHVTIGTGTLPYVHGMFANTIYDKTLGRGVACMTDPTATSVPFGGGTGTERHSGRNIRTPAFADELRLQARRLPNIVSVALKPRSAIGLGGNGGPNTVVLWEENNGTWATSDAYTKTPWADVDEYVHAHPLTAAYGQTWSRVRPESTYLYEDDAIGENSPAPWTRTFPHKLESRSGKPDNEFVTSWERSPWSDEYVVGLAKHLLASRKLGTQPGTDMLALSLTSLDLSGHEFGPRSHEVQDTLIRADALIGGLLDALDRQVGAGRYVVAFSADHGVAFIPEQAAALGMDAGRIVAKEIGTAVETTIAKHLGPGTYCGICSEQQIWLRPGTLDQLRARSGAVDAVKAALEEIRGVERILTADELQATTATDDAILRASRLSYVPGRSADFIIVPKPYWMIRANTGTGHGTPHEYDRRVPVVLYGGGITPGRYLVNASPVDIVPTLAALARITLARTDGRVLTEALAK
jgi:predicted AlkP superfamily pyrophosphatase or phosphodiesterase